MKKISTFICLFFSILCFPQDKKAEKLLDEVYQKMVSYKNVYVDFKYNLDNPKQGVKQETQGNVTLQGNKYLLNYMGATKLFDGKKTYTIIPENEEVTIETPNEEEELTPSKMFSFYKKGYHYKWDILQNVRGRQIQYIDLKPIKSNSEIKQILLGIDINTKHIYNLIQVGKNDTRTTIVVTELKTNQTISENMFIFNKEKYKKEGYYINE